MELVFLIFHYGITVLAVLMFAIFCVSLNRDMKDLERKIKYLEKENSAMRDRVTDLMWKKEDDGK